MQRALQTSEDLPSNLCATLARLMNLPMQAANLNADIWNGM